MAIKAIIFDAYGTLFDVHSVTEKCEQFFPGMGMAISQRWRQKQLEYTWLRSLMGRYEDFWKITSDALDFTLEELKLSADEENLETILNQYLRLRTFPEVPNVLRELGDLKLAILSNGSPGMLDAVVRNAGLDGVFEAVISVDELGIYKPSMAVYELGVGKLGVAKEETLFLTANPWDAAGAKAFGYRVCWVNRSGQKFDALGIQVDFEIGGIGDLGELLNSRK